MSLSSNVKNIFYSFFPFLRDSRSESNRKESLERTQLRSYSFVKYIKRKSMAGVATLFNGHILNKSKEEINLNDDKYKGKVIGLYFSAHWFVLFICLFDRVFF